MYKRQGWQFLSIGRRLERLMNLSTVLQVAVAEGRHAGLDWLLELADSGVTYRSRYVVAPEWLPVLHLLVCDATNPRAVAFQVKGLDEFVEKLESRFGRFATLPVAGGVGGLDALRPADLDPESPRLAEVLASLHRGAGLLSDELTLKFFSHAPSRSVLSMAA